MIKFNTILWTWNEKNDFYKSAYIYIKYLQVDT